MDFAPASLGNNHSTLDALGHKDFEPVSLRHKDFEPAATGLDLSLAKFDPIDMSTRVAAT